MLHLINWQLPSLLAMDVLTHQEQEEEELGLLLIRHQFQVHFDRKA